MKRLLARVHLPLNSEIPFLYRESGENVGPMDGSLFSFCRAGELINAYALWETLEPITIGRGSTGTIAIYPHTPQLWEQLRAGETVFWSFAPFSNEISAQIVEPLTEGISP